MSGLRGWCPTAWRPMAAGDGLILRIRPRLARLSPEQARTIAEVARAQGNGLIDVTNRAALQLRGLTEAGWPGALDALIGAGLVDPDPRREARAMLVAPDWCPGDDTHRLGGELIDRLDALPPLPGKIGLAIDAGEAAVLTDSPADFRIERGTTGALILRADGRATGCAVRAEDAVAALVALTQWFVASGGGAAGRMARHDATLPDWARGDIRPVIAPAPPMQGAHPLGTAIGLTFGRITADRLEVIADLPDVTGMRLTPWRMIVVEGVGPDAAGLADAGPVDLSVDACVGAPACPQATVETRALALRLSAHVAGRLHVSGCAKGCARHAPAAIVATGREGRFDLSHNARAGDPPIATGLTPDALLALFESDCRAP